MTNVSSPRTSSNELHVGLEITSIILTVIANLILLFMQRHQLAGSLWSRPVHSIKHILCWGSLFLTFYSYVIFTAIFFDGQNVVVCRASRTALIYESYFYPFVFGLSIFVQGLLLDRPSNLLAELYKEGIPKIISIIFIIIPWTLALLLVCPLTMAGTEWSNECKTSHWTSGHLKTIEIMCVIVPASAAFVCGITLISCKKSDGELSVHEMESSQRQIEPYILDTSPEQSHGHNTSDSACNLTHISPEDMDKQRSTLCLISFIFVVSVVPQSAYNLTSSLQTHTILDLNGQTVNALGQTFYWIKQIYPVVIPLVCLRDIIT